MTEPVDAGRLICKVGEDGYVRERGDWIDISEDGQSGRTYVYVDQLVAVRQQLDQYRWRRVEDELPEEGEIVLSKGSHIVTVRAMYEAGKWWCCEDDDLYWITGVTHWMPIPPLPYQEEG